MSVQVPGVVVVHAEPGIDYDMLRQGTRYKD